MRSLCLCTFVWRTLSVVIKRTQCFWENCQSLTVGVVSFAIKFTMQLFLDLWYMSVECEYDNNIYGILNTL